jgi:tRNA A-37 threonylcarbamoyl transferase component Bud32
MSQTINQRRDLGDGSGRTALVDGSVVAGYTVTYLASGGMSVVYKGQKLGKTVVLKEVQSSNTKEVPSLISEKTLLERLSHPGLVGYHAFFTENGYYYLVVDYVPGEPLAAFLHKGEPAPVADVADWGVQLCEIFTYLHEQQPPIIYRDLKSENILLHDGKVKLIDFGIARVHKGDRQKDTELMGSPVTASPEHYGGAETDARSDIYTLGATIYELLTGGRRKQVGAFQFAPVRDLRPDTPVALDKAVMKALAFKPGDRWQTAEEFRNAILTAMGKPIPAWVDRRSSRRIEDEEIVVRKKSRTPLLALVALLVLLVLVGAAVQGGYLHFGAVPPGEVKSLGSFEANLDGKLFGAGKVGDSSVVFMGEDVGLFQVTKTKDQSAEDRANTLAKRLNVFYAQACPSCGGTGLEPNDIKVGRFSETGDIVVFYAHLHGFDELHWGPELLATVDEGQAKALGTTPKYLASYWRDLIRDTVSLSRGFPVENSALGEELAGAFAKARKTLSAEESNVANLRRILKETTGSQALALREIFSQVPDRKPAKDDFGGVKGYEPLRD